jgi:hypothetical protein
MTELYKAIWLEVLFLTDMLGEDMRRVSSSAVRKRWLRDCQRSGYLHPSVFRRG